MPLDAHNFPVNVGNEVVLTASVVGVYVTPEGRNVELRLPSGDRITLRSKDLNVIEDAA